MSKVALMLDSGAFSAFRAGTTIDLKKYIAYVKKHEKLLSSYVSLDVLPLGRDEKNRTREVIERAALESHNNHKRMKDAGLTPIPVFHMGESFKWLDRMLADKEPYIGISTIKSLWNEQGQQIAWLEKVWHHLSNAKGEPIVRTHGFGITSYKLLAHYPWYTVDSTTWSKSAGYGRILIPKFENGKYDYSQTPKQVTMSSVGRTEGASPKWRNSRRGHFEGLGPVEQEYITKYFEQEVGIKVSEAIYSSQARRRALLVYYKNLCASIIRTPFSRKQAAPKELAKKAGVEQVPLRMIFATAFNPAWEHLMQDVGIQDQLLSYYLLRDVPDSMLEQYIETGVTGDWNRQTPKTDWPEKQNGHNIYSNYRRLQLIERDKNAESEPSI